MLKLMIAASRKQAPDENEILINGLNNLKRNKMKETPKKAAKNYIYSNKFESPNGHGMKEVKEAFIDGAKWMQERMYSEEDMREAIIFGLHGMYGFQWGKEGQTENQINKYLQQFKKK